MYMLDPWYFTLDIWHWYLSCYTWHLILDTWYLTPVLDMLSLDTWYLTSDIWHLTIDMLSLTWLMLSPGTSTHLTWYCDTWLDTITPDTCITWHIHDYHFYGNLAWLLYCYQTSGTPELLYSWTPVLLNSCIPCTHVPCTVTLVNSMVILASGRACLVSGWWGCISRSC